MGLKKNRTNIAQAYLLFFFFEGSHSIFTSYSLEELTFLENQPKQTLRFSP